MASTGTLVVEAYTAKGAVPLEGVSVVVTMGTGEDSKIIASRVTNYSGKTSIIVVETPEEILTEQPSKQQGFTSVNVQLYSPNYESVLIEDVQIFPNTESIQQVEMIPLGEVPKEKSQKYYITPQNL